MFEGVSYEKKCPWEISEGEMSREKCLGECPRPENYSLKNGQIKIE